MAQAHQNLAAIPAGERRPGQAQRFGQHQRVYGDGGVDEAMRPLLGIGVRVFVHLQGHDQHDDAQYGQ